MDKVRITIDGNQIEVDKNTTVLEACKKLNILVPTFCYNEKLPIFGGCRMCLVWEKNWKRTIIACGTYVYDGMKIETMNDTVFNDRKFILEMLFTRHPLDCPVCDKAGECDLQNWGTYYGPQNNVLPITAYEKVRPEEDWQSEFLEFVSNRCVLCLKCISVCENINGSKTLYQEERGFEIVIAPNEKPMDSNSSCEMCGLCVDICPVGAILFKPFKYNTRPWLLNEKVSYCGFCSMNCPVAIDYDNKQNKIYRIRSTADLNVCAGAYLGYDTYENNRLKDAKINNKPDDINKALKEVANIINSNPLKTALIADSYSPTEVFLQINKLTEKTGIKVSSVITADFYPVLKGYKEITEEDYLLPAINDLINCEKVVIIGDDISAITPVISYFFNDYYKEGNKIASKKKVIYIGNNLQNSSKFFPDVIKKSLGDILNEDFDKSIFDEKTCIFYSTSTYIGTDAYKFGKILGKIKNKTNSKVFIIPYQANAIGVINNLNISNSLSNLMEKIENKQIKNLIIFGEEIYNYINEEYLKDVFAKLDNIIVISPFEDGAALTANIAIGSTLWMEEEGTFEGIFGKRKITPALKPKLSQVDIISKIIEYVKFTPFSVRTEEINLDFSWDKYTKQNITLKDFGYFSYRSHNLMKWKEKGITVNIKD